MVQSDNGRSVRGAVRWGGARWSLAWVFLLGLLASCRPWQERLRVGANLWLGYEPLFLAERSGLLREDEVEVIRLASAEQVISAFRNRALDVAAVTADEAVRVASRLDGTRIIFICDYSNGADAIVARPEIRSAAELKGRKVGLEPNVLGAYFLARALASVQLTPADIMPVPMPTASQEEAYRAGRVDAVVTFDPVRSRLLGQGARSVFDSSQIPGEIVDVVIARPEVLERRRPELLRLVQAWFQAREQLLGGGAGALAEAAPHQGLTVGELGEALKRIEFPDLAANRRLLIAATNGLGATLQRVASELAKHRLLEGAADPGHLIDPSLLEGAVRK